jgi:hypothetical protein
VFAMAKFLTTSQIAEIYGLADSTVRHYRSSGRLVPSRKTPGGHARYAIADVISALGEPGGEASKPRHDVQISGMEHESFAPPDQHDLRFSGRGGILSAELVAIGRREVTGYPREGPPRWGGRLLRARSRVGA